MFFFALTLVGLAVAGYIAIRNSDGPLGPIPGGQLVSGELVDATVVDWSAATKGRIEHQTAPYFVELELVETMSSRTTGAMLYYGDLFIPCDLGQAI